MYLPFFLGVTTTTMKLWTLAEISGELATAPQISSTPGNNLITLNLNDKSLCHLPYVFPFTFTDPSGSPWNALGTYEGFAAIALESQHLKRRSCCGTLKLRSRSKGVIRYSPFG